MSFAHVLPDRPKQLLPREAYISEAWLALEREHLFNKAWTFAGAVNALAHPGDYLTLTVGTSPLIVLRTGQGELRAYHNLCRHRGTELLEGCGQLKSTIVCPYHRWTFDLEGRLRGVLIEAFRCVPPLLPCSSRMAPIYARQGLRKLVCT